MIFKYFAFIQIFAFDNFNPSFKHGIHYLPVDIRAIANIIKGLIKSIIVPYMGLSERACSNNNNCYRKILDNLKINYALQNFLTENLSAGCVILKILNSRKRQSEDFYFLSTIATSINNRCFLLTTIRAGMN